MSHVPNVSMSNQTSSVSKQGTHTNWMSRMSEGSQPGKHTLSEKNHVSCPEYLNVQPDKRCSHYKEKLNHSMSQCPDVSKQPGSFHELIYGNRFPVQFR